MVAGTLYTYPGLYRGFKAQVSAALSGFDLKTVELAASDKRAQVPAFESTNFSLSDANAIAYYVANDQLRGATSEHRAEVLQWLGYGGEHVVPAVAGWVYPSLSLVETCPAGLKKAESMMREVFAFVNTFLKTRTFLVGERLTLADVSLAADLLLAYRHVADEKFRKPYGNLNRWFLTVVNQDSVSKVFGQVTLCETRQEFCANKFQQREAEAKAAAPPKEKKPAAQAAKPKEAPKPKAPEPEDEDEDMPAESNAKDPFAEMPKGTFNMDEFKRTYSNEDTAKVALPYFWKHFEENKELYSIWYCQYKYPEELSQIFMTNNLVGGMFQRLEKLRKNSFANMAVYGTAGAGNNTIAGVWFWKGQELAFPLDNDWTVDYESYDWRKLDCTKPEDRKLLEESWQWIGEVDGKKFNVGKTYK